MKKIIVLFFLFSFTFPQMWDSQKGDMSIFVYDANNDGIVNSSDLAIIASNAIRFGGSSPLDWTNLIISNSYKYLMTNGGNSMASNLPMGTWGIYGVNQIWPTNGMLILGTNGLGYSFIELAVGSAKFDTAGAGTLAIGTNNSGTIIIGNSSKTINFDSANVSITNDPIATHSYVTTHAGGGMVSNQVCFTLRGNAYVADKVSSLDWALDGTVKKIYIFADTAPVDSDLYVDIRANGESIFSNTNAMPRVIDGANSGYTTTFSNAVLLGGSTTYYLDTKQVGSTTPGGGDLRLVLLYTVP